MTGRGTFLLTFDVELVWGLFFERRWRERALARYGEIRPVFAELLDVLARHDVRATFAFVGHLFLDRCERGDGGVHPEMVRPDHGFFPGDWYGFDPATDLETDPLWYGRDLVESVRAASPEHEIGAHGFSHAFLDGGRELARSEMAAAARAAAGHGIEARSFVFPRNVVAFTDELGPAGFTCYRAADAAGAPEVPVGSGAIARAGRFARRLAGAAPPVGRPRYVDGVVEVPSSLPILPGMGLRRAVPAASRLREVRKGLERARDRNAYFHLWTHPHNFVEGRARMIRFLDRAMALVAAFRERGEIDVLTMGEVRP